MVTYIGSLFKHDKVSLSPDIDWVINVSALDTNEFLTLGSVLCTIISDKLNGREFGCFQAMSPVADDLAKLLNGIYQLPNMTRQLSDPPVIVNDVWINNTTRNGNLLDEIEKSKAVLGAVLFSRGELPDNVVCVFQQYGGEKYNANIYDPFGDSRFGSYSD